MMAKDAGSYIPPEGFKVIVQCSEVTKSIQAFIDLVEKEEVESSLQITAEPVKPKVILNHNLTYFGIPQEMELQPVLEYLRGKLNFSEKYKDRMELLDSAIGTDIYVSPSCTFCPNVVRKIIPFTYSDKIKINVIDITFFDEFVSINKIHSVPTTIIEDRFRFTGDLDPGDYVDAVTSVRGEPDLKILRKMLDQGNALYIADAIRKDHKMYSAVIQLLMHEEFSVRVGAMVIIEELMGKAPDLVSLALPQLLREYSGKDVSVRGDILYLIGETGNTEHLPWLKQILKLETHPELIEAIQDAIISIEDRENGTS